MNLLEPHKLDDLIRNHREQQRVKGTKSELDLHPVVKLFVPWGAATFLISECDPDGLAFGLADLGFGSPELGYISLDELAELRGPGGLTVEQDLHFKAEKPLSQYSEEARRLGRIQA
ncbi:DUF2958 domain-containing protein [Sphingomonas xinjiangensis]|uniref:DUF2958 domain-containing protein n=1 Tax=Sphingomonas xinjiangensis TaxID=643568 RepID=UPI001621FD95|nr:DUF2958 domain-containing protein [Sphingomonas xinjiangensis]